MNQSKIAGKPVAQINVRIDRDLKEEGDAVLAEAGISPTQIVRELWGKLAQRGDALDEVMTAFGAQSADETDQAIIDARLAIVDRVSRRRDKLARALGLSDADTPIYHDDYDWRDRAQAERDRRRDRRGVS